MTRSEVLRDIDMASRSPGFDGFAFQADVWCLDCIIEMANHGDFDQSAAKVANQDNPIWQDSEILPQPIFFGESDHKQCCNSCAESLYGPDEEDEDA